MHHQVDTIFLSANGKFNGKLQFEEGKNVMLRKKQYDSLNNDAFCLKFAKAIAGGKISNQIAFMNRINRKREAPELEGTIAKARANLAQLENASSIDAIRGYEGTGSRLFFSVFKLNINPEWAIFKGRSRHPPRDNVNAVLSFLYTLLMYRVDAFIEMVGLDPYVGYLHTLAYGKRSLTFDMMEEFRTSICDTLACALFNLGMLTAADFETVDFSQESDDTPMHLEDTGSDETSNIETDAVVKGVLLSKQGIKKVSDAFEEKIDSSIFYPPENDRVTYQKIIALQVERFKRLLLGEETEYKAFVVR